MATFEEGFLYPLILLLVGAGLTSLLIPWFTKRWEDRKKELEIKVDIASKIAEVMAFQIADSAISITRKKRKFTEPEEDAFYEYVRKRATDFYTIRSKLESYFSETDIIERWRNFAYVLGSFGDVSRLYF